jgi:excisionase family DNA binding protein
MLHDGIILQPITTSIAARILEKSEGTVRQLENRGVLKAIRTAGNIRLFDRTDVERVAREYQRAAEAGSAHW